MTTIYIHTKHVAKNKLQRQPRRLKIYQHKIYKEYKKQIRNKYPYKNKNTQTIYSSVYQEFLHLTNNSNSSNFLANQSNLF